MTRLMLHIFARNLAYELILWSYVRIDYNIEQKYKPRWWRRPSWIFAQTLLSQLVFELD